MGVLGILKPHGVLVNPSPDDMLDFLVGKLFALFTSKSVSMIIVESKTKDLEQIGTWLSDGSLGIDVDSVHEARSIAAAIDRQNHPSKQEGWWSGWKAALPNDSFGSYYLEP